MTWFRIFIHRLHGSILKRNLEQRLEEEIHSHLEMQIEENLRRGMKREEARYAALRKFGGVAQMKENYRDRRGLMFVETTFQDLRYAARTLRKNPGFTIVVLVTLALGIGANTAIFSVFNALMLRPLPYPNPERLFWVEEISNKTNNRQAAWGGHFLDWQDHSQTLAGIAAVDSETQTLTGAGEPQRVVCGRVSASFFPMLGVQLLSPGRNFSATEDQPGGERVAILSHRLWQRRYSGDREMIGKTITLNDANFTVIGVLPADFRFFYQFDVWLPLALDPQAQLAGPTRYYGTTIALLKPGIGVEQAQVELDTLSQRYETTRPQGSTRVDSRTHLTSLQEYLLGNTRRSLLVLLGGVALVLLIACANVANLLLARSITRQKELALRAALGAGRWRLVRQMLTECLLLALAGGAIGLLLAYWLTSLLGALNSTSAIGEMAGVAAITIDLRVLGFTLLISLLTGLFFGLLPALQVSSPDLNISLKDGGGRGSIRGRGLRSALMVSEVAMAIVLLVGAGLLIRSFIKLVNVDPGYQTESLLTARLSLPPRYSEREPRVQFYEQILQRLAALPGVSSVGATSHLPLSRYNMGSGVRVEGRVLPEGERPLGAPVAAVNPDYFRTMSISLRAGRFFNDNDTQGAPSVAVISESLARRLFPNEDPLEKRVNIGGSGADWTTIVGIASDIRHQGLDQEIEQAVYLSYRQLPRNLALVARTTIEPASLAPAFRNAVHETDPSVPVYELQTMNERVSNSVAARRFNLLLLGGFAALALLLAGVGVYGVISYIVTQRTHEIGIRMALGAQSGDVVRLFIKQGMALVILGVVLGLVGAFTLTRVMTSLLFNVSASDPLTYVGVAVTLSLIALLACYIPARRATKVDSLIALRAE
jgi:predicted permease